MHNVINVEKRMQKEKENNVNKKNNVPRIIINFIFLLIEKKIKYYIFYYDFYKIATNMYVPRLSCKCDTSHSACNSEEIVIACEYIYRSGVSVRSNVVKVKVKSKGVNT